MTEENTEHVNPPAGEEAATGAEINEDSPPSPELDGQEAPSGNDTPAPEPEKSGIQKRIDELTRQREEARREAAYYQGIMSQRNQAQADPRPQAPPPPTGKPNAADFESYDDYLDALTDYKTEQKISLIRQEQYQQSQQQAHQQRVQSYTERERAVATKYPDYDAVVRSPDLPISQFMANMIMDSDNGPDIAYHLGHNPAEAARIAQLPPYRQAMELGAIRARISSAPPKRVTQAPAPIRPVGTSQEAVKKDPADMSMAEYIKWRQGGRGG